MPRGFDGIILVNTGSTEEEVELVCMHDEGSADIRSVEVAPQSSLTIGIVCNGKLALVSGGRPVPTFIIPNTDGLMDER